MLGRCIQFVAQTGVVCFFVGVKETRCPPSEEAAALVYRRARVDPGRDVLDAAQRLDPARHGPRAPIGMTERASAFAPGENLTLGTQG